MEVDDWKDHFSDDIVKNIEKSEKNGGVFVDKLEPGTRVVAVTRNSTYDIEILNQVGQVKVQGGKYFPESTETYFAGSTWGGSMLKLKWIGLDMCMEFSHPKGVIVTSRVKEAKVIGKDWEYEMEWPND